MTLFVLRRLLQLRPVGAGHNSYGKFVYMCMYVWVCVQLCVLSVCCRLYTTCQCNFGCTTWPAPCAGFIINKAQQMAKIHTHTHTQWDTHSHIHSHTRSLQLPFGFLVNSNVALIRGVAQLTCSHVQFVAVAAWSGRLIGQDLIGNAADGISG